MQLPASSLPISFVYFDTFSWLHLALLPSPLHGVTLCFLVFVLFNLITTVMMNLTMNRRDIGVKGYVVVTNLNECLEA